MQFLIDNDEEKDGDEDDDEVLQSFFFPFDTCIALAHCRHFGIVY